MENERVKCPSCHGLKCNFINSCSSEYVWVCSDYDFNGTSKNHLCGAKCTICGGIGYVDWIDLLFLRDDNGGFFSRQLERLRDKSKVKWQYDYLDFKEINKEIISEFYKEIYGE